MEDLVEIFHQLFLLRSAISSLLPKVPSNSNQLSGFTLNHVFVPVSKAVSATSTLSCKLPITSNFLLSFCDSLYEKSKKA
jgi:hypothetical protein